MIKIHLTDREQTFLHLLFEQHAQQLNVFGACEALGVEHTDQMNDHMADAFATLKHKLETKGS